MAGLKIKHNGVLLPVVGGIINKALLIKYNNLISGRNVTTVQSALDKSFEEIDTLNTNLGMPIRVNSETNKPEWKDVGADTWNPFKANPSLYDDDYFAANRPSSNTVTVTLEKGTYIITLAFHGHIKDSQTQILSNCNVIEQLSMIQQISTVKGGLTEIQLLVEATEDNATFSSKVNCSASTSYWLLHFITAIKIG